MSSLRTFLDTVLGGKPDDNYALIWVTDGDKYKVSYWVQNISDIVELVEKISADKRKLHIYIGCGWTDTDYGKSLRAKADNIIGIPALWTDVDVGEHHKKKNLPPDIQTVRDVLARIVPMPTIVVNSGHGLHLWWIFNRPWIFENDGDRKLAAQLSRAWQEYIRAEFKKHGWDLDTTSDLPRVLRPPETTNWKNPDAPKNVELTHSSSEFYDPEILRDWLKQHSTGREADAIPQTPLVGVGNFTLVPHASPPVDKWMILQDLEVKVRQSWAHKRRDMQDQSQSGYDLSLAAYAAGAGWSDQEIANLIIANRRYHKVELMLENRQYYERTIRKAREGQTKEIQFTEEERQVIDKVETVETVASNAPLEDDERKTLLGAINRMMEIGETEIPVPSANGTGPHAVMIPSLANIIQYTKDPPVFYVELYNAEGELKKVKIGDSKDVRTQAKWSEVIYGERLRDIPEFKKAEWLALRRMIAKATERQSPGVEGSETGMVAGWINDFANTVGVPMVMSIIERSDLVEDLKPFIYKGKLYFSLTTLVVWLRQNRGRNVDDRDLSAMVKNIGASPQVITYKRRDGRKSTQRMWMINYYVGDSTPADDAAIHDIMKDDPADANVEEF